MNQAILSHQPICQQNERDQYFDLLRGIAIIFVIAIHVFGNLMADVKTGSLLFHFYTFWRQFIGCAVPVFLAISGYFMARKSVNTRVGYVAFLSKQIPRVYIPCLIWSMPYFYWQVNYSGLNPMEIVNLFLGGYSVYYFILLIMQYYFLLPFLQKLSRIPKGLLFSVLISGIFIIGWIGVLIRLKPQHIPLLYQALSPIWIVFFVLGLFFGFGKKLHISKKIVILLLIGSLFLSVCETYYLFPKIGYFPASGIKISAFLYCFFVIVFLFNDKLHKTYFNSILGKTLVYIGKISFGIYLIHMYAFLYINLFFNKLYPSHFINETILSCMILLVSILMIYIAKKINDKFAVKYLGF